jgi:hypothetical protein
MHAIRTLPPLAALLAAAPLLLLGLCLHAATAQDKDKDKKKADDKKGNDKVMALTDAKDKVHKVTEWKFLSGTRRLGWLADEMGKKKDGPEAFVLREVTKINYKAGVETLIPLPRIRKLTVESDLDLLTVFVTVDKDEEAKLSGTTKYKNINWFTLETEVDEGDKGVASVRFQGGSLKGNVKSISFPAAKVGPLERGRPAAVQTADDNIKETHKVSDLMALYALRGGKEMLSPVLMFKKTLKLDVNKLASIESAGQGGREVVWKVKDKAKDAEERTLTLLDEGILDGKDVTLLGLVGKVPAGYKLFPPQRITAIHFDADRPPPANLLPPPLEEKQK